MISANMFVCTLSVLTKILFLYATVTSQEVLYWRSMALCLWSYLLLMYVKKSVLDISTEGAKFVFYRSFFGAIGFGGKLISIQFLDLSKALILHFT